MLRSVGALICGFFADRYGRKWPMIINLCFFIVLELGSGFCQNLSQFLGVRALYGIAMGGEQEYTVYSAALGCWNAHTHQVCSAQRLPLHSKILHTTLAAYYLASSKWDTQSAICSPPPSTEPSFPRPPTDGEVCSGLALLHRSSSLSSATCCLRRTTSWWWRPSAKQGSATRVVGTWKAWPSKLFWKILAKLWRRIGFYSSTWSFSCPDLTQSRMVARTSIPPSWRVKSVWDRLRSQSSPSLARLERSSARISWATSARSLGDGWPWWRHVLSAEHWCLDTLSQRTWGSWRPCSSNKCASVEFGAQFQFI